MNIRSHKVKAHNNATLFSWKKLFKKFTLLKLTTNVHQLDSIIDIIIFFYEEKYKNSSRKVSSLQVHFKFIIIGLLFTNIGSKFTFLVWKD